MTRYPSTEAGANIVSLKGGYRTTNGGLAFTVEATNIYLPAGDVSVLLGGNGSGKSTFLKALSRHPDVDVVSLDVTSPNGMGFFYAAQRRHEALFRTLTVGESLFLAHAGNSGGVLPSLRSVPRSDSVLDGLPAQLSARIAGLLDQRSGELSGGQRALLVLAMTLRASPSRILLMDEPDAGADTSNRELIGDVLKDWATSKGVPVLVATHLSDGSDFDGARLLADDGTVTSAPRGEGGE